MRAPLRTRLVAMRCEPRGWRGGVVGLRAPAAIGAAAAAAPPLHSAPQGARPPEGAAPEEEAAPMAGPSRRGGGLR
eukprot:7751407-Pyramimonas_sp.AAC.1